MARLTQPFDDSQVSAILEQYSLTGPVLSVEPLVSGRGFSGARIWKVTTTAEAWALRRWPGQGLSAMRLTGLHQLVRHLADCGVSVIAVPCRSRSGETLVTHGAGLWQLEPWQAGVADFNQRPSLDRLRHAMRVLAQVHVSAARFLPSASAVEWFCSGREGMAPAVSERLERLTTVWTPAQLEVAVEQVRFDEDGPLREVALPLLQCVRAGRELVLRDLREASGWRVPLQPCLRDVWHDHLLFTGDTLTGLIDLSAARTESVASDLSRLLGSLLGDDRPDWWQTALSEYARHRPLTVEEGRLVDVLDRSAVLMSGLTWIERRQRGAIAREDLPRVVARLETIHTRLSRLVQRFA